MFPYSVHFCVSCPLKARKRHVNMLYTLAFLIHLEINLFEIFLNPSSRMPLGAMQCSKN